MLDIKKTAESLERLIIERQNQLALPSKDPECGVDHLCWMCRQIYNEFVSGHTAYMWLGFVQGVVTGAGGSNLEEIQDLMENYDYE